MTKTEVKSFRTDFEKAVAQLEKHYGVSISLGTIRFSDNELRAKMTATKNSGIIVKRLNKNELSIGDSVSVKHPKVNPDWVFRVVAKKTKNVVIEGNYQRYTINPNLIVKK